jgi:TolB-like protein/Tfp pilus assembly protein PilF
VSDHAVISFRRNAEPIKDSTIALEPAATSSLASFSTEEIRLQVNRILASQNFRNCPHLKSFLTFVVDQTLDGHHDDIKEYSLGVAVFQRGESFDPKVDPIVRVQARNLRSRLRDYYEKDGHLDPIHIEFPKGGYAPRFTAGIGNDKGPSLPHPAVVGEDAPLLIPALPAPQVTPQRTMFKRPLSLSTWKLIGVLATLVALLSIPFVWLSRWKGTHITNAPSIVVLPLLNGGGDQEGEIFSDGLTEELIDSLGRIPGLHVVARTSAYQFKGKSIDIREIGKELNARTVLEGSVRKSGHGLRVSVQLDDATTGYRIWSGSYDRDLKDSLLIQREISQAITGALKVELSNRGPSGRPNSPANYEGLNPDSYRDYLKARYYNTRLTAEDKRTATTYFERAIAEDPDYAPAYVGLAHSYVGLWALSDDTPAKDIVPKIRAAASKALELDNTLGEAYLDLALTFESDYEWMAADRELKKGLELSPGAVNLHLSYVNHLMRIGEPGKALIEAKTALNLDPMSANSLAAVARALYQTRRYDEALDVYRKAIALDPSFGFAHRGVGEVDLQKGLYAPALKELESARQLMEKNALSTTTGRLGYAYAVSGNFESARQIMSELTQGSQTSGRALPIAEVFIGLGDKQRAFEWLKKAIDQGDISLYLKTDPLYDTLRGDSRFDDLLLRMKLNQIN